MFDVYEPLNDNIDQKMDQIEMDIEHHLDSPMLTRHIEKKNYLKRFLKEFYQGNWLQDKIMIKTKTSNG
jgi:hypothetical protein